MLGAALFSTFRDQFERTIDTLGVPIEWENITSGAKASIVGGIKIINDEDNKLVQSYGSSTHIITIKSYGLARAPEKFDRFSAQGSIFVAETVAPINLNGSVIGYRIFVNGH